MLPVSGAFTAARAWQIDRRYLAVALMPIFAGLQQFMEGHVWWGVSAAGPVAVLWGAMGVIFFTWSALPRPFPRSRSP